MNKGLCFFLVLCLVNIEFSQSLGRDGLLGSALIRILDLFGFGRSSSENTEENISQEHPHGNLFLSRVLSDPNLRASADNCNEKQNPMCDPHSPFRTYDGICNNLQHPTWGSVNDCLVRILPPFYEGRYGMRSAVNGGPLPSPRDVSLHIFSNKNRILPEVTLFFTAFGQIVAHDQSLSTPPVGEDITRDPGISCCPVADAESPDCASIIIRPDDPFYSNLNITCLHFLRGVKCFSCKDTGKEQIYNGVTGALDVNIAYGTSEEDALKLRTNDGTGRLLTRYTTSGELLSENTDPNLTFCPVGETESCFMAGDPRVNQHTYLASLQTILAREHNRLVTALKAINPFWNDEKLYQTGRKILGAKLQAIVYGEYLPILLGKKYMAEFNLSLKQGDEGTRYDPSLRFGSWAEYSTGTFRAHSMIPSHTGYEKKHFRDMYSNNHPILNGHMSQVLKGSCRVMSEQFDQFEVTDVSNFTYKQPHENYGQDLVAIDIQRGRDHGLPPYVHVLNYCSSRNDNVTTFDQLSEVMSQENIQLLKLNYKSLQDVDLYVGMQMENSMKGSVLTPTSACVVAGQSYFAKYGDRFYFEHVNEAPSFTSGQRESIKKSTIGGMICKNTNIENLQKNVFLLESPKNPALPCSLLPDVDLSLWRSS